MDFEPTSVLCRSLLYRPVYAWWWVWVVVVGFQNNVIDVVDVRFVFGKLVWSFRRRGEGSIIVIG